MTTAATALSGLTVVATFLNKVSFIFSGMLDFRVRFLVCLGFLVFLAGSQAYILLSTHLCTSVLYPAEIRHYTFRRRARLIAAASLLIIVFVMSLALSDIRYWFGKAGALQGRVADSHGRAIQGVLVNAVNLDDKPVCDSAELSAFDGLVVLDMNATNGRGAYFTMEKGNCTVRQQITNSVYSMIDGGEPKNGPVNNLVLRFDCQSH